MCSPQKRDGGKQAQLNASPPKQLEVNEATANKPDISEEMPVFSPRSPRSTSTPKPVPEQTFCIDLSLHPKQGGSSVQPRTTTTLPNFPTSNSPAPNNSPKLRQQLPQPQVQQPVLPPSTCQQLPANALAFPCYSFLQQLAAVLSMPSAVSILTPVNAEQPQANRALSEAQRQGRRRVLFTPYQIGELLKCYKRKNYITPTEREELARRINLTGTQVKIWFQNHRYKTRRAGGKVSDGEASVTEPKLGAVEDSVASANSWDSSLSEGNGNAEGTRSQQGPQQTVPPPQQAPARQGAYVLATQKHQFKSLAQLLENQLDTETDIRQDVGDGESKVCSELTKRVIGLVFEASAS
ncbi:Homeobox protein DTH-2 [Taenia solium]